MSGTTVDPVVRLQQPLVKNNGDPHTFHLGLVLTGTVAAGAWTAGVLDALMEALDTWEQAKADGVNVPKHRVQLEIIGGASGGGVCAAVLARAASRSFPHVHDQNGDLANPFWDVWVNKLDIDAMLDVGDLPPGATASAVLNGNAIRLGAQAILDWGIGTDGVAPLNRPRAWLADPFHVLVTLTNLRGVPYEIGFDPYDSSGMSHSYYVSHADHALFAFPSDQGPRGNQIRPDEWRIDCNFVAAKDDWHNFGQYVQATGAFPVGFPPLRLSRPVAHYGWRAAVIPEGKRNGSVPTAPLPPQLLTPAWGALLPVDRPNGAYTFDCVDGGACNNEPLELVRAALAGLGVPMERDAKLATTAIVMIDPFAAGPECKTPVDPSKLLELAGGLVNAWKEEARYATSDLLLALDKTVFSRFLLTASRVDQTGTTIRGGSALSGSGLGAFLGFLDRDFRVHDFMLGRQNCLHWLQNCFVLDQHNPIFGDFAQNSNASSYRPADDPTKLCVIPLVAPLRGPVEQPPWPNVTPAAGLQGSIKGRLTKVLQIIGTNNKIPCSGFLANLAGKWAADYAFMQIRQAMTDQGKRA